MCLWWHNKYDYVWLMCLCFRLQRVNRSPGPGPQPAGRHSPGNAVTSMVSMNFNSPSCLFSELSCEVGLLKLLSTPLGINAFYFCLHATAVSIIHTYICDPQNVRNKREKQRWTIKSFREQGRGIRTLSRWYRALIHPQLPDTKFSWSTTAL